MLRARLATAAPPVFVQTAPPPPSRPRHRYPVALPAALTALGVATLITGGALYGVSGQKYDDLTSAGCGTGVACYPSRWDGTRTMERAGIGLLVSGGVLGVAAVALWGGWKVR